MNKISKFLYYIFILTSFFIFFLFQITKFSYASENPLNYPNNKYGIHIIDENDLDDAANIVNTSGGDWGYVTIVIREDERINKRWQDVFNKMRRLHLIPIIRIASEQEKNGWKKLNLNEIDNWISFLNSLNWVVQNRYIIVGNEPNHSTEWGGDLNPEEYANYLYNFSKKLKSASSDYFILPAALDSAANNTKTTMSSDIYLKKMLDSNINIFEYIDGWNSHSYPNISRKQSEVFDGKHSINTYKWELDYLKQIGITKDLPVFITETGWKHAEEINNNLYLSSQEISDEMKSTYDRVWNDERIIAITPFVLNYSSEPFNIFSWKKNDKSFYDFVKTYQEFSKKKGRPAQRINAKVLTFIFPPVFYNHGEFRGIVLIKNTGQSIFNGTEKIYKKSKYFSYVIEPKAITSGIEPFKNAFAVVKIRFHLSK